MIAETGPWDLGLMIGLPTALLLAVACLACGVLCIRSYMARGHDPYRLHNGRLFGVISLAFALFFAIGAGYSAFPYDAQYHQWRQVSGEVEKVSARLIADGSGMSERYVFVVNGQEFGVDDTRASLTEVGDEVSLSCKREWQWSAKDGYQCRWGQ